MKEKTQHPSVMVLLFKTCLFINSIELWNEKSSSAEGNSHSEQLWSKCGIRSLGHHQCVCCCQNKLSFFQSHHQQMVVLTRSLWTKTWSSWKRLLVELGCIFKHFRREMSGKRGWAVLAAAVNVRVLEAPQTKCREHQSSTWLQYEETQVHYRLLLCQPSAFVPHLVWTL